MIVNIHWGSEFVAAVTPSSGRWRPAHGRSPAIDAIVGQHVHVVQPIRRVHGKPVVFGEGNLVSNQTAGCCPAALQDGADRADRLRGPARPPGARARRVRYLPTWVRHPDSQ